MRDTESADAWPYIVGHIALTSPIEELGDGRCCPHRGMLRERGPVSTAARIHRGGRIRPEEAHGEPTHTATYVNFHDDELELFTLCWRQARRSLAVTGAQDSAMKGLAVACPGRQRRRPRIARRAEMCQPCAPDWSQHQTIRSVAALVTAKCEPLARSIRQLIWSPQLQKSLLKPTAACKHLEHGRAPEPWGARRLADRQLARDSLSSSLSHGESHFGLQSPGPRLSRLPRAPLALRRRASCCGGKASPGPQPANVGQPAVRIGGVPGGLNVAPATTQVEPQAERACLAKEAVESVVGRLASPAQDPRHVAANGQDGLSPRRRGPGRRA